MRIFFVVVGVLAWLTALGVMWIFAESGGALTVIAAGVFAGVAIVALGCERVLKVLEEIRDGKVRTVNVTAPAMRVTEAREPANAVPV
jgi:uncharacterized membrane protein